MMPGHLRFTGFQGRVISKSPAKCSEAHFLVQSLFIAEANCNLQLVPSVIGTNLRDMRATARWTGTKLPLKFRLFRVGKE